MGRHGTLGVGLRWYRPKEFNAILVDPKDELCVHHKETQGKKFLDKPRASVTRRTKNKENSHGNANSGGNSGWDNKSIGQGA